MRIAVAGGTGIVGRHVVESLAAAGVESEVDPAAFIAVAVK